MKKNISIITVCYNDSISLSETIDCIRKIKNDHSNIRYFVIDGGSNDGTFELLNNNKDCIDYWVSEPDLGIYDAMNKGWAAADNDSYILFLGSGDMILSMPDENILADCSSIVYGDVLLGASNTKFISKVGRRLTLGNTIHHQALLIPKMVHQAPPFNLKYKVYADFDFNLRLYMSGFVFVKDPGFIGYAKPDGVSSKLNIKEMKTVVRDNCGLFNSLISVFYLFYQKNMKSIIAALK